jgi:anti-sigma regulatory factor (Ser/Thr protein kinase)
MRIDMHENGASHDWPLQSGLPLGPLPTAVSCARAHAAQILWEWRMCDVSDGVKLIVSELVTNAVTASRALAGGPFPVRLWLLADGKQVLILVWDASPAPPVRMQPDHATAGGRGLMLVDALAAEWDWYRTPAMPEPATEGKVVWALVARA